MNLWQPGKGEIGLTGEGQDREKGEREDRDRHSMGALGDLGSPFCRQRYIRGCTTVQPPRGRVPVCDGATDRDMYKAALRSKPIGGTSPAVTVLLPAKKMYFGFFFFSSPLPVPSPLLCM
jgi:hypothetical protein